MKKRIMIFCDFYLPGFKSGGGMWTVVNLVDRFCDQFDFFIVTRNFDGKSDRTVYKSVKTDEWNTVGNAQVYYCSSRSLTSKRISGFVGDRAPDAFFLNSAFSLPVRRFLSARSKGLVGDLPVILAPCGEMAKGALSTRPIKKKVFLKYAEFVSLYKGVIWKASSDNEREEICEIMGKGVEVMIAPDVVPRTIIPEYSQDRKPKKLTGSVRFVVIARLVPKKNVSYFLERLVGVRDGNVSFDIVGPLEDPVYWKKCQEIIARLPSNITVNATGAYRQTDALQRACESHFFAMPTLNENFGYVLIEGLAAGCPLLISDRTVWKDIDEKKVGWQIPLEEPEKYVEQINRCIAMDDDEYSEMSRRSRQYATDWLAQPGINEATAHVLARVLEHDFRAAKNGR
jgi:glycosyltransferase involved in cell wall biosynthesis